MSSVYKLAIIALTAVALGALQYVIPVFPENFLGIQNANSEPVIKLLNTPADNQQIAHQGTLYFVPQTYSGASPPVTSSPLLHTEVDINVTGIVARTKVTQNFKNASEHWVNGTYVFPLPEGAAVDHLLMTVGDRKIEGQIKPKKQAKRIFEQAKKQGKKASLVSQQRPNMFTNQIANIGPGETISVTIEYQQKLMLENQTYSLRFPMTITPRYNPSHSPHQTSKPNSPHSQISKELQIAFENAPNYSPAKQETNRSIDLQLNVKTGFELANIKSEFHPISNRKLSDGSTHIQLPQGQIANKDFVISWQPKLNSQPEVFHFTQKADGHEYGLIMLQPPAASTEQQGADLAHSSISRDITFVLDTSGSMEGESIVQAKQALLFAINQLQEHENFNLIEFNSYAQNLWYTSQPATQQNKVEANTFIHGLTANGGTNIGKAFTLALNKSEQPSDGSQLRQIIFITDGSVSNEEALMHQLKSELGNARLFTVGIGSAPNTYFMTEAANIGRGSFTYIGHTNQVKDKISQLVSKIQHPVFTDIQINVAKDKASSLQDYEFYPRFIQDLYLGEPIVLSYRRKITDSIQTNSPTLTLSGLYNNQGKQIDVQLAGSNKQSGLNVLWAREKITQLTRDRRSAQLHPKADKSVIDNFKQQITNTALNHHIVSQYTSLVAVDVTPTRPIEAELSEQKVVNRLPSGSVNLTRKLVGKIPQTATIAELKIYSGLLILGLIICMHLLSRKLAKPLSC